MKKHLLFTIAIVQLMVVIMVYLSVQIPRRMCLKVVSYAETRKR